MESSGVIIIGGGLWGQLLLSALRSFHPQVPVQLLETQSSLAKDRTWSCHGTDVPETLAPWFETITSAHWDRQLVHFPRFSRDLGIGYFTVLAKDLAQKTQERHGEWIHLGVSGDQIEQAKKTAALVIDTRPAGPWRAPSGYQKFLGQFVRTTHPHQLKSPILMDARVEQKEGYRFLYVLPLEANLVLVEDTRYSLNPHIDVQEFRQSVKDYWSHELGLSGSVEDEEQATLPIPLTRAGVFSDASHDLSTGALVKLGFHHGFFQPVTGYSLPICLQLIHVFLQNSDWTAASIKKSLTSWSHQRRGNWHRFLYVNRLMFGAASDHDRYLCFQRFYHQPESAIARFYSGSMNWFDWVRFFTGKPPVPVMKAMAVTLKGESFWSEQLNH